MYQRTKFQVSRMILTSLRQEGVNFIPLSQNDPLKSPPRLGLRITLCFVFLKKSVESLNKFPKILLYLNLDPHLSKKIVFICFNENLLKMMKNAFYFYLKSTFRSQDIQLFVLTFWKCAKNGLIRKIYLISKSVTSQPG